MTSSGELFARSEALLGAEAMARLKSAHVLVVGVGGVGSWCAEALVRTGLGAITLMDDDRVVPSNVNRQCPATSETLGQPKVEALKTRLLAINPDCKVNAVFARFTSFDDLLTGRRGVSPRCETQDPCVTPRCVIIDAIDSVPCKAELILGATERGIPIVSSMGAALRTDPTKVVVRRFDKVEGDGLARALRQRFKKLNRFPASQFPCVCSTESPASQLSSEAKGSIMPVTATFGMCLAAEAIGQL